MRASGIAAAVCGSRAAARPPAVARGATRRAVALRPCVPARLVTSRRTRGARTVAAAPAESSPGPAADAEAEDAMRLAWASFLMLVGTESDDRAEIKETLKDFASNVEELVPDLGLELLDGLLDAAAPLKEVPRLAAALERLEGSGGQEYAEATNDLCMVLYAAATAPAADRAEVTPGLTEAATAVLEKAIVLVEDAFAEAEEDEEDEGGARAEGGEYEDDDAMADVEDLFDEVQGTNEELSEAEEIVRQMEESNSVLVSLGTKGRVEPTPVATAPTVDMPPGEEFVVVKSAQAPEREAAPVAVDVEAPEGGVRDAFVAFVSALATAGHFGEGVVLQVPDEGDVEKALPPGDLKRGVLDFARSRPELFVVVQGDVSTIALADIDRSDADRKTRNALERLTASLPESSSKLPAGFDEDVSLQDVLRVCMALSRADTDAEQPAAAAAAMAMARLTTLVGQDTPQHVTDAWEARTESNNRAGLKSVMSAYRAGEPLGSDDDWQDADSTPEALAAAARDAELGFDDALGGWGVAGGDIGDSAELAGRLQAQGRSDGGAEGPGAEWACPECGTPNFATRTECRKCYAARGNTPATIGDPFATRPGKDAPKPGDWACGECGAVNYSRRKECYKCDAPKTSLSMVYNEDLKPGDWICPECSNHNFAHRDECRRCGADRPSNGENEISQWHGAEQTFPARGRSPRRERAPRQFAEDAPEWLCTDCGIPNRDNRSFCRRCDAPRDRNAQLVYGDEPRGGPGDRFERGGRGDRFERGGRGDRFGRADRGGRGGRGDAPDRPEWLCTECGIPNRDNRHYCRRCDAPRAPNAQVVYDDEPRGGRGGRGGRFERSGRGGRGGRGARGGRDDRRSRSLGGRDRQGRPRRDNRSAGPPSRAGVDDWFGDAAPRGRARDDTDILTGRKLRDSSPPEMPEW
ncbi:unnamed protein product [Pedinophyceae sp. YPF-701]|nr:unnamed protein product [Pedinophyceae sp. YPF-701]